MWWPRAPRGRVSGDARPDRATRARRTGAGALDAGQRSSASTGSIACSARAAWAWCGPRTIRISSARSRSRCCARADAAPQLRQRLLREARAMAQAQAPERADRVRGRHRRRSRLHRDGARRRQTLDAWLATRRRATSVWTRCSPPVAGSPPRIAAGRRASRLQAAQRAAQPRRPRARHRLRPRARRSASEPTQPVPRADDHARLALDVSRSTPAARKRLACSTRR